MKIKKWIRKVLCMYRDLGTLNLDNDDIVDSIEIDELRFFINRKTNSKGLDIINLRSKEFRGVRINVLVGGIYKTFFGIKEESAKGVHEFTDFFYDDFGLAEIKIGLSDKASNTLNNYSKPLIKFLNYIYKQGIKNIEELDKDMIKEFLNLYSYNLLPDDCKSDTCRSKTEVNRVNQVITKFIFWLFTSKKTARNKKLKYNMKYFEASDFKTMQYSRKLKSGGIEYRYKLRDIVTVNLDNSNNGQKRSKAIRGTLYTVKKLIEVSRIIDPMITFAIILDSFAGLRLGEVMQMHNGRLKLIDSRFKSCSLYIDLTSDSRLRSDRVKTGEIKVNREQPIFEVFADVIRDEYLEHQELLLQKGFLMHKYGALFINEEGKAMTSDNYMKRFRAIAEQAIINIKIEAAKGNELAIREERLLEGKIITPHSLRYIYSQFIKEVVGERTAVAYFRGDQNIKSQDTYIPETNLKKAKELFMSYFV
ncbi:MAG: site-specific recombinase XerD [Clostridium sp. Maddingley MBC34-26]|nr:MAG: site-specific recombinase XerD [Clostridium sp. Maddingley MBC34-26]